MAVHLSCGSKPRWRALRDIAAREGCKVNDLCTLVQMRKHPNTTLTAAIRVFLMLYFRAAATDEGHARRSQEFRRDDAPRANKVGDFHCAASGSAPKGESDL